MSESPVVKTTCPYCGVGCGIVATTGVDGSVSVRGDPDHPSNYGRLCSKGAALAETIGLEDRLLRPRISGRDATWDESLNLVAEKFSSTIADNGPQSVAFYVSGQLLTEDYYVANKLMKGFIGSANIDTNSRLCMASSVAGHKRAFGSDTVPGCYEDLELADLIVLVGSNAAWCHPVLYQRIAAAKEARPQMKVVLIDPRETATATIADLHLAIKPDADVALFAGLLRYLVDRGHHDRSYIAAHTTGFDDALAAASRASESRLPEATGLTRAELDQFYALFAATERAVTIYSQGVNQSASGTDKVNAIINCHLATGRIGRPGMGPFSVTGQPNAMGGREVGGLANMLAAHMDIENAQHRDLVRRFWQSPAIASQPGLKAVDMFKAVADGHIKALWIMATNPAVSMPEAHAVEAALAACPFVVVSDVVESTDTLRHAHVLLPAAAWGEKNGTVTNSERRISRQRPFLPMPGAARPDWWIICEVAKRMGFGAAFAYDNAAEIFTEHAALSCFENDGRRDFDISAAAGLGEAAYDELSPFQWPAPASESPAKRVFGDGKFYTPDGKARFVATETEAEPRSQLEFPLVLNTGRVRDQWHTMARTGKSPRLSQHIAEPYVEIHPKDAMSCGIADATIVKISGQDRSILARALITRRQQPGSIFVPMHWQDQQASLARVDGIVLPSCDRVSGQPALKQAAVRIEPFAVKAYAFAILRDRPTQLSMAYWAIARCEEGWRAELAFGQEVSDWRALASDLMGSDAGEMLAYHDETAGQHRFACFHGDRLSGALFVGREPVAVSRDWAVAQLSAKHPDGGSRLHVIAGRPGRDIEDKGRIVCSCFGIGARQIADAVRAGFSSVAAVGTTTGAGTNCGSCHSEILKVIEKQDLQAAE